MKWLHVRTPTRNCFLDITSDLRKALQEIGMQDGAIQAFVPHTTAGITITKMQKGK